MSKAKPSEYGVAGVYDLPSLAAALGIKDDTLRAWRVRHRDLMPEPAGFLSGLPVWTEDAIEVIRQARAQTAAKRGRPAK